MKLYRNAKEKLVSSGYFETRDKIFELFRKANYMTTGFLCDYLGVETKRQSCEDDMWISRYKYTQELLSGRENVMYQTSDAGMWFYGDDKYYLDYLMECDFLETSSFAMMKIQQFVMGWTENPKIASRPRHDLELYGVEFADLSEEQEDKLRNMIYDKYLEVHGLYHEINRVLVEAKDKGLEL